MYLKIVLCRGLFYRRTRVQISLSRFSITTSITQSKSSSRCKSSSIFPGVILFEFLLCISISGLDLSIFCIAVLDSEFLSSAPSALCRGKTSQPALAQWAAIPAPSHRFLSLRLSGFPQTYAHLYRFKMVAFPPPPTHCCQGVLCTILGQ